MNSTIGIDNLFIQPLVNVILYTVKKIERLVQQEKKSRLLQAVIAARLSFEELHTVSANWTSSAFEPTS